MMEGSAPHYRRQYLAAFVATLGAFSIGTSFGWSAPVEPRILDHGELEFAVEGQEFAWVVALMALGGAVISLPAGLAVPVMGARNTLLLFVVPAAVGWALILAASSVPMLLVGRLFTGFGAGAFCMVIPIYLGEMASTEIRGTVGSFFQQMINLGILYVYVLGMAVDVFRLGVLCALVPIVYGVLFVFMPNTPTYLVLRNNEPKALASIKWLRGSHFDAAGEVREIQRSLDGRHKTERRCTVWRSFREPATARALATMVGLMFFMQTSGINAVLFYSTSIFQAANVAIKPELATILLGLLQVLGTLLSALLVDRLGRRLLLLASSGTMCVNVLALGVYLQLLAVNPTQVDSLGWIPVLTLCLYVTLFSVGLGPVPWLMLGEIFPNDVKGPASALANITSFGLSFAMSRLFPLARDGIGSGPTFVIFAGFCLLAMVFVVLVVPETKGKSLADIQKMLAGGSLTN
ncbi:facilitated trehalose transporter Tret1-like [Culex quinquefasciatus]|uniref:facilitated trehalose transporter Tret1-like n=1 Tax=Culex quinquefasciatus TaxID=7176 RepID=UPI0018E2C0D3|nr:facilitated trehalose transporter Tret1-like [Culex quinquefasciatus]